MRFKISKLYVVWNRPATAVVLDEPGLELAPPAPEPSPELTSAPEPAEVAAAALPSSPPPEPQHAEREAGGDEQVEVAVDVPAKSAGKVSGCPQP
jgi:hypothetical protein